MCLFSIAIATYGSDIVVLIWLKHFLFGLRVCMFVWCSWVVFCFYLYYITSDMTHKRTRPQQFDQGVCVCVCVSVFVSKNRHRGKAHSVSILLLKQSRTATITASLARTAIHIIISYSIWMRPHSTQTTMMISITARTHEHKHTQIETHAVRFDAMLCDVCTTQYSCTIILLDTNTYSSAACMCLIRANQ